MAYLRKHSRSPYWYIRKRTFEGKWVESTTGLRIDSPDDTARAKRLADKSTVAERDGWTIKRGSDFKSWVPSYLATHYKLCTPATRRRMEIAWHTLSVFFQLHQIIVPRQVTYRHAADYLAWRINRIVNRRPAGHNTARLEIKFLSQLMGEAVRMDLADSNPFQNLVVPKALQRKKKALSDDEIAKARREIKDEAEWMAAVFEIMLYTGCRFGETSIALDRIDMERNNLTMVDSKRKPEDPRRNFTIPLPSELRSIFETMKNEPGRTHTVHLTQEKNGRFNRFLKASVGASSHSIRVTFITRCHASGLGERQTMRLVNHSSRAVHDIYSRMNVEDVREAQSRILIPARSV